MPRIDSNRGVALPYRPGNPSAPDSNVEQRLRNVWDELTQIAIALAAVDQPVSTSLNVTGTVQVNTTPVWSRLFNTGFTVTPWVNPNNSFDPATGIYTFPQEGVYTVQVECTVTEHTTPANKGYYAGIRATIIPADGSPPIEQITYNGGFDSVPLSVYFQLMRPAQKGTQIYFDVAAVHTQTVGPEQYTASAMYIRQSGTGNNVA